MQISVIPVCWVCLGYRNDKIRLKSPGQKSGCAGNRNSWSNYPASCTCSAHGCFSRFALRLAPTMPSAQSRHPKWPNMAQSARMHDDAVWNTLATLLGEVPPQEADHARAVALLPAALGGLGLLSAARPAPVAYWAGTLAPQSMQVALRRRLRLPLPFCSDRAHLPAMVPQQWLAHTTAPGRCLLL